MIKIENPETFRSNVTNKLSDVLLNEKLATNMERGVYNYSIKQATDKQIIKKWDNIYFVELYKNRLRTIYINLKNDIIT